MKEEIIKKSNVFVEQYAKIRLETAYKNRNKYIIISRFDSEKYRRWKDLDTLFSQLEAESYID